ncbi:AraC family transcriptional regulator, partial [Paenibacillus sepulcri]|nr:AraC family transcriptional regulator [Paenibacillus sepulcri]
LQQIGEKKDEAFWELKLSSCMLQLTEMILAGWERAGCPERPEAYDSVKDRFGRLIGLMTHRLHEKLGREELAAAVRLSPNYLDKAFGQRYGLTPMQMLRDMRLKRSRQLLERTEATLESIASQCGMTDASYLSRQFKRAYGVQPGEYRESVRSLQAENPYGNTGGGGM